jgi:hypothetical protein
MAADDKGANDKGADDKAAYDKAADDKRVDDTGLEPVTSTMSSPSAASAVRYDWPRFHEYIRRESRFKGDPKLPGVLRGFDEKW